MGECEQVMLLVQGVIIWAAGFPAHYPEKRIICLVWVKEGCFMSKCELESSLLEVCKGPLGADAS